MAITQNEIKKEVISNCDFLFEDRTAIKIASPPNPMIVVIIPGDNVIIPWVNGILRILMTLKE